MARAELWSSGDGSDQPSRFRDARDTELLERMRTDPGAFAALVRAWWAPLVGYATRMVDNTDAAEDVVQEAFIRFWEKRADWRSGTVPRVLLYTLTRNLALNRRKFDAVRERSRSARRYPFPRAIATPVEEVEGEELRGALTKAIDRLSPRRREVLLLSRVEGLTRSEIAQVTGLSPQSVANCLVSALADLRNALREFLNQV